MPRQQGSRVQLAMAYEASSLPACRVVVSVLQIVGMAVTLIFVSR